jgi:hypothetical protein
MKLLRTLTCALAGLVLAAQTHASPLYAATAAGGPGQLYIIDPANGAVIQNVGPLINALGTNFPITGMAFHPVTGVLYGSTGNNPDTTAARLVTIDPVTAQVTVIGSYNAGPVNGTGTPATMADLAFDSSGNLYGVGSIGGPQLYSINPATGQATVIGSTGLTSTTGGGLAISPTGTFYGTPTSTRFGTYDSGSGAYTDIGNPAKPAGGGAYGALDFDENGVLFGLNVGSGSPPPTHLVIMNPANAGVTDLGASLASLDAIAFQIPEPGTTALMIGSLAFSLLRRRG